MRSKLGYFIWTLLCRNINCIYGLGIPVINWAETPKTAFTHMHFINWKRLFVIYFQKKYHPVSLHFFFFPRACTELSSICKCDPKISWETSWETHCVSHWTPWHTGVNTSTKLLWSYSSRRWDRHLQMHKRFIEWHSGWSWSLIFCDGNE